MFSDPEALAKLNALTHPLIFDEMQAQIAEAEKSGAPVVVLDVPLLFESGHDADVARTVVVTASQKLRIQRIRMRDGATRAEALRRIRSQMPDREKVRRADYVISNNGTFEELEARTRKVFDELMETMDR